MGITFLSVMTSSSRLKPSLSKRIYNDSLEAEKTRLRTSSLTDGLKKEQGPGLER